MQREKKIVAKELKIEVPCERWVHQFCRRQGMVVKTTHGEALGANDNLIWKIFMIWMKVACFTVPCQAKRFVSRMKS